MFNKILSDINEEFKSRVKNHLVVESYFYFTNEEKRRIENDDNPIKELNINLFRLKNLPVLTTMIGLSLAYDLYMKKTKSLKRLCSNGIKRILIGNLFYYTLLIDYDQFYSIIYRKYIKYN